MFFNILNYLIDFFSYLLIKKKNEFCCRWNGNNFFAYFFIQQKKKNYLMHLSALKTGQKVVINHLPRSCILMRLQQLGKKSFQFRCINFSDSSHCAAASFTANFAHKYFRRLFKEDAFAILQRLPRAILLASSSCNFKWARFSYNFQNCARSRFFFRFLFIREMDERSC